MINNSTLVKSNSRFSFSSTQTRPRVRRWPFSDCFQRFKIGVSHTSTASETAIGQDITAAIVEASPKQRVRPASILLSWSVVFRTDIIHDVLPGIRTRTRRQRSIVDNHCGRYVDGTLRAIFCWGSNINTKVFFNPFWMDGNPWIKNTTAFTR